MKKAFILILSILYISLTSGVMLNIHYCMGEFAGINYGHEDKHGCDKCGTEKDEDCCNSELKLYKTDDDHLPAVFVSHIEKWSEYYYPAPIAAITLPGSFADTQTSAFHYDSPPDHRLNNIHVYNQVFRI